MPKKPSKMQQYRGFLCHAGATTAACVPGDPRSVVVPRKPNRALLVDHSRVHDLKYSRLADSMRFTSGKILRPPPPPPPPEAVFAGSLNKEMRPPHPSRKMVGEKLAPALRNGVVSASCKPKARATDFALQPPRPAPAAVSAVPAPTHGDVFQVVVMKVSLHCQGCACKVKKHISKMEGVTSFSIDLESKRVTVMGHISPTGVLESISKIKKAEFWAAATPTTAAAGAAV